MPDLGQVPEIDVPSYLPDLPGIAADLMYSADLGPGIAPSAPSTAIPELPTFSTEAAEPLQPGMASPCTSSLCCRRTMGLLETRCRRCLGGDTSGLCLGPSQSCSLLKCWPGSGHFTSPTPCIAREEGGW